MFSWGLIESASKIPSFSAGFSIAWAKEFATCR